jgi:alanine racemase
MYHNLNTLTIFPERLKHNLAVLQKLSGIPCVPVVKSNAYGHGLKLLAKIWNKYDIRFLCVDSLFEAYELQKYGYKKEILIMGFVNPDDIPREKKFHYACSDISYALAVVKKRKHTKLHLFFDTGMRREGIQAIVTEGNDQLILLKKNIVGIMTHLSKPDDVEITQKQIDTYTLFIKALEAIDIHTEFRHICASGGSINRKQYKKLSDTNARTGISYYGYGHPELLPAIRCTTSLIQIKHLKTGESAGYDGTFVAKEDMLIGILPMGYNDGLDRRFSNKGNLMIRKTLCPILGRVSMNITIIDISKVPKPVIGESVVFISENTDSPISLEKQAHTIDTIPYDLLVHLNKEMYRKIG